MQCQHERLFAACGISRELVKLMEGRYNKTVMLAVAAADVISAVLSFWWLVGFPLVNPEFTVEISALFRGRGSVHHEDIQPFPGFLPWSHTLCADAGHGGYAGKNLTEIKST